MNKIIISTLLLTSSFASFAMNPEETVTPQGKILNAVQCEDIATVTQLLDAGVSVHTSDSLSWTLLHWASLYGYNQIAQLLVAKGARVDAETSEGGSTPLHEAAGQGHLGIARILLEAQADADAVSRQGFTPLHSAALSGQPHVAQLLLEYNANPQATTDNRTDRISIFNNKTPREIAQLCMPLNARKEDFLQTIALLEKAEQKERRPNHPQTRSQSKHRRVAL